MIEWIAEHWLESIVLVAFGGSALIQISPLKINPWSAVGRAFGRLIGVESVKSTLDKHIKMDDERYMKQCRLRILRFSDELIQGKRHTKEHFNEILDDITEYKRYCRTHLDYENDKAVMAIKNVESTYEKCQSDKTFL